MNTTISNHALLTQLAQANGAQGTAAGTTAPASADAAGAPDVGDSVKLTDSAKALQEASRAGDGAPVDTQKVERIRQSIADGSYQVDAGRIADGVISLDRQIGGGAAASGT